jgi:uncharacterized PurR-regulated membrane protein YhhQ (DUF165 family)
VTRRQLGYLAVVIYVGSVVAANWLTTRYGLIRVGFGLRATAGTLAIGGAIMLRDLLQDALGRWAVLASILVAAGLSYLVAAPVIAVASGVTFLIAETAEFAVYTPLRQRVRFASGRWAGVVASANVVGALLDTLLFLALAGFPVTGRTVAGQMVGKAYVTVGVLAVAYVAARRRRPATAA